MLAGLAIIKKILMIEISWNQRDCKTGRTMHIFIIINIVIITNIIITNYYNALPQCPLQMRLSSDASRSWSLKVS